MNRTDYINAFQKELKKLNPAQRQAATDIEGTMMVIAGPGTGKTHVLSARIGYILLQTDTAAHNILCLTYTDAAVQAMRGRLLQLIGPEAYKVHIYTFHSFCNAVIQDNLTYFGKDNLEAITDLERVGLIRALIDELPESHLLRQANQNYAYERHLNNLFDTMKREGWSAEHIAHKADLYIESLPQRDDFVYKRDTKDGKKGELKKVPAQREAEKIAVLKAAAQLFERYQAKMAAAGRYDFQDMLQWVCDAFAQNLPLLQTYQEQYLYVMADEFQDTNGLQSRILYLLTDYWERPNLFVVGDDDQAIYEFQGARIKNMLDFRDRYADHLKTVVLTQNYRSTQLILDVAKTVIENNQLRLVNKSDFSSKDLRATRSDAVAPEIIHYPNTLHEVADIVAQIQSLSQKGVPLNDIAVIYARHEQAEDLTRLLQSFQLPYTIKRRVNILQMPVIKQLIELLNYFEAEYRLPYSGESYLYHLLHYTWLEINRTDIAKLSHHLAMSDEPLYLRNFIAQSTLLTLAGVADPAPFTRLAGWLDGIFALYRQVSLPVLLQAVLHRSGFLAWATEQPERTQLIEAFTTFLHFIRNEAQKNEHYQLPDLLRHLEQMEANKLRIEIFDTVAQKNAVVLTTAHSSKGLEFEHVFIVDASKEYWEDNKQSKYNFFLPDTLTLDSPTDDASLEEKRRLFYVALTRAKTFLYISKGTKKLGNAKEREATRFLEEVKAVNTSTTNKVVVRSAEVNENDLTDNEIRLLEEARRVEIDPYLRKDAVDDLLRHLRLSATIVNQFIACPLGFYFKEVLHIPLKYGEKQIYGDAVHFALSRLYDENYAFSGNTEAFLRDFERSLDRRKAYLTPEVAKQLHDKGKRLLPAYFEQRNALWETQKVRTEMKISHSFFEEIPLTGRIDKIVMLNKTDRSFVDFKTTKYEPAQLKEGSGEIWRQLVFYKILAENDARLQWRVESAAVEYLYNDTKKQFIQKDLHFTSAEVQQVQEEIRTVWKRIKAHDFMKGCGKEDCSWCNFARKYYLLSSDYIDKIGEIMDDD